MYQAILKNCLLFVSTLLLSESVLAINQSACSTLLNNGFYKKYEYGGIDQPVTKATKRHGTTKGTFVMSTEGTTAILDPKYWSNVSTSGTQGTSSWGNCSLIGLQRTLEIRETYIAVNKSEVLKDIARADGEHLAAIGNLTMCDDEQLGLFNQTMQKNLPILMNAKQGEYNATIDKIVSSNPLLKNTCFNGSI